MYEADLLVKNAKQIVYFEPSDSGGRKSWQLIIQENGYLACLGNKIVSLGSENKVTSDVQIKEHTKIVDANDRVVTPGLIDPHTHPIFFNTREAEFEMRVQGKSYEEIAAAGGGIRNSVRAVRKAGKAELKEKVRPRLKRFLELGTTTIEAKSGYGLSFDDEIKSLEIISELNDEQPLEMLPTFLGAHEVPDEFRTDKDKYIERITKEMIPEVVKRNLAKFCDVFCEKNVYSLEESQRIMQTATDAGLKCKIHADQLHLTGATELAVEMNALSADHLEQLDKNGIEKIANSETVACLLPGSVFFLGSMEYPPARKLVDSGAFVALASDFNPGSSMTQSMPLMMTLACLFMKMTPAEALIASTIGAAKAIDCEAYLGNLQQDYQADFVIWDVDDYRQIPYYYGVNLVHFVIKKGTVIIDHS